MMKASTPKSATKPVRAASFAAFVLERMPELASRLNGKDFTGWLEQQDRLDVDGAERWLIWGDRLADEPEMKLNWAREHGLIDEARVHALQAEYLPGDPDVEAIEAK